MAYDTFQPKSRKAARRPETRAARIAQIVDIVARKVSRAELMERAGFRKRPATKRARV
jgi:hypothetical protein